MSPAAAQTNARAMAVLCGGGNDHGAAWAYSKVTPVGLLAAVHNEHARLLQTAGRAAEAADFAARGLSYSVLLRVPAATA